MAFFTNIIANYSSAFEVTALNDVIEFIVVLFLFFFLFKLSFIQIILRRARKTAERYAIKLRKLSRIIKVLENGLNEINDSPPKPPQKKD